MAAARGIQDLPVELWRNITAYLGIDEEGRVWQGKRNHQLATLCLVSRRVYACIVPLLYEDVFVRGEDFPIFLATISSNRSLGALVKKYVFRWSATADNTCSVVSALDDQVNTSATARSSLVMDLLQQTVQLLPPQLHELGVKHFQGNPESEDPVVKETWRIDLRYMTGLRSLWLGGFGVDKAGLDALLNMETLQDLCLNGFYAIETTQPSNLLRQPSPVALPGRPGLYTSGLMRLCLYGSHDLKPYLRAFLPHAMHLQDLEIDSPALWDRTNSWEERDHLYKILPSSLETLHIRFPETSFFDMIYSIPDYQQAFDGVFLPFSNETQNPANSRIGYNEADIPTSRYVWLTNLLGNAGSVAGIVEQMYLPSLKVLKLVESRVHASENTQEWIEDAIIKLPEEIYFQLPTEIEGLFAARSIEVSILVKDAWKDPCFF